MASTPIVVQGTGRYEVHDSIATGGMASLHLGRLLGPLGFSRTVAIKRLRLEGARSRQIVSMFLDEAHLAARIRHPNVVPTLDIVTSQGELLLVMEYVHGESLANLLQNANLRNLTIPPPIAAAIVAGMLHGLHAAHVATDERGEPLGIIHRDVSPHNVVVSVDGIPRLTDFGVAKPLGRARHAVTGRRVGKIGYAAPEQMQGSITRQVDVYAAAVVLWETLTARRLFTADTPEELVTQINTWTVPAPSGIVPGVPVGLDAVTARGLRRDPHQRYLTAREMALDIEACITPAQATEVAAWVDELAHDAIEARARLVRRIESGTPAVESSSSSDPETTVQDEPPPAKTEQDDLEETTVQEDPERPTERRSKPRT